VRSSDEATVFAPGNILAAVGPGPDRRRPLLIGVALALAFVAQYLFTGELLTRNRDTQTWDWPPRYTAASLLLLAGVAAATRAFQAHGTIGSLTVPTQAICGARSPAIAAALAASGLCYASSVTLFVRSGESPGVRWLWLAAIVLLLLPIALRDRRFLGVVGHPAWEWGLVSVVTLAGFWLRCHDVADLPAHVHPDIALMGNVTLEMMATEPGRWLGLAASQHPASMHQVIALGMRLFGRDYYGLVMPSVLAGTATIPILYLLGRALFGRAEGLVASGLLAISYTHIHFSRTLFGPIATLCLTLALVLLIAGLRTGAPLAFALSGAVLSFGLFNYDSSRVGPVLVAATALWQALFDRGGFRRAWRGWTLLATTTLVVFGPKIAIPATDFASFAGRGTEVAIWNPYVLSHTMAKYEAGSVLEVLLYQARDTFLTFHLFGDGSPHFSLRRPMVSAPASIFLVLGTGFALARPRNLSRAVAVLWVFLTLFLGGVLTADPPYWPHLNIALPAVSLLAALGAVQAVSGLLPDGPSSRRLGVAALVAGLVPLGIQNWEVYVGFASSGEGPRARGARYVDALPSGSRVYLVSHEFRWSEHPFRFFGADQNGRDATRQDVLSGRLDLTPPAAVLLYDERDLLPVLEGRFPGGVGRPLGEVGQPPALVVFERLPRRIAPPAPPRDPLSLPGWWAVAAGIAGVALRATSSIRRAKILAPCRP